MFNVFCFLSLFIDNKDDLVVLTRISSQYTAVSTIIYDLNVAAKTVTFVSCVEL